MPSERFFSDCDYQIGGLASIVGAELHHLAHVMRIKENEEVELVNGRGALASAKVLRIDKKQAELKIFSLDQQEIGPPRLLLAFPLMRPSKMEWVIEKGTELGADSFQIYPAQFSEKDSLSANQLERLRTISISAMKQSGRLTLPVIQIISDLKEIWPFSGTLYFGDIDPNAPYLWDQKTLFPALFVSGPERGFSEKELKLLSQKESKGVRIHPNILRAETAPLAALCLLSSKIIF